MDANNAIAKRHRLKMVKEAACGFGATLNSRLVGTLGHTGWFTFRPRIPITSGIGGMTVNNDARLAERLSGGRDYGNEISDSQRHIGLRPYLLADHTKAGYNQPMTDLQAAHGAVQMQRSDRNVTERRRLGASYNAAFADLDWLQAPQMPPEHCYGYQSYPCLFEPDLVHQAQATADQSLPREVHERRHAWMETLQQQGVSTRPATHPVHMICYNRHKNQVKPDQSQVAQAGNYYNILLPLFHGMISNEQRCVIDIVLSREV
jgi:perosamine synthetase